MQKSLFEIDISLHMNFNFHKMAIYVNRESLDDPLFLLTQTN